MDADGWTDDDPFPIIFGCTEFTAGVSRGTFNSETDFEVRYAGGPQKPHKHYEKLN